jgi:hypothetical protein
MKNEMPDYVIVTHERATFFAERGEESEYSEGYFNVFELDSTQSTERNHYCISDEFIHELDWDDDE